MGGRTLKEKDKNQISEVKYGDKRELLDKDELSVIKKSITESMKYIKPYRGPSKTWFANQDSLREGCNMLAAIISDLPVNKQSSGILVKLLLRLGKKLTVGGVDDSNGIVGGFMSEVVQMLLEYVKIDSKCVETFNSLADKGITSFGWEEPLVSLYDEKLF